VSSWWGGAGLKRRAVSAVTDTRAELFVFRKEEVEVRAARSWLLKRNNGHGNQNQVSSIHALGF
jgi:hypothetical protein